MVDGRVGMARIVQPVATIAGRFRIDPFEAPLGGHEPGLGETQIWFYCDRAIVPKPWPVLGDHLTIRNQLYEIVQRDEDDIGEFGFRLIRQEIGISTVTSEGAVSGQPIVNPLERRPAFARTGPKLCQSPCACHARRDCRRQVPARRPAVTPCRDRRRRSKPRSRPARSTPRGR